MSLGFAEMNFIDKTINIIVDFIETLKNKQKVALLNLLEITIDELIHNKSTHA